jgi:hypothetical protein
MVLVVSTPPPAPQGLAAPVLHLDAETEAKLSRQVPIVQGGWLQGYRETQTYCRVLFTDEFVVVAQGNLGNIVARYTPRQARPDLCPPGTLVLADIGTQMVLQMVGEYAGLYEMIKRPW